MENVQTGRNSLTYTQTGWWIEDGVVQRRKMLIQLLQHLEMKKNIMKGSYRQGYVKLKDFSRTLRDFPTVFKNEKHKKKHCRNFP